MKRLFTGVTAFATCLAAMPVSSVASAPLRDGAVPVQAGPVITADAERCEAIRSLVIDSRTKVTAASLVPPGFIAPGQPPLESTPASVGFCRVNVVAEPEADSHIEYEVWMPVGAAWNGRLQGIGGYSNSGSIMYDGLASAVEAGYAAVSTDNGHKITGDQTDQRWAVGHPAKVADFGYRAIHVSTVGSKTVVAAFYGRAAHHSYWVGCSQGGNKALMLAQRWPLDYDGIIAGNPVRDWTRAITSITYAALPQLRDRQSFIPATMKPVIHQAVLDQCDALDGLKDGIVSAPGRCAFKPKVLQCSASRTTHCLSPTQTAALAAIYNGFKGRDGQPLTDPFLPGSEDWPFVGASRHEGNWSGFWPMVVHEEPKWDPVAKFSLTRDLKLAKRKVGWAYDADNPDLSAFAARGGKLLMYHGLADQVVSPRQSSVYFDDVIEVMGPDAVEQFARLYLVGGMGHCGGGAGASSFDLLPALVEWVEQNKAPTGLVAQHHEQKRVTFERPLCPYPRSVIYRGSGNTSKHSSFACE